ncbi:MAG: alanine dehydrogenase [bacterium]|nr:alanine dehydrogenase [bacterium]
MIIGIPKEVKPAERRIALTPTACAQVLAAGHQVVMEQGAGQGAGFEDQDYASLGVKILLDAAELYGKAELVVKVKEPQPEELPLLRRDHILFCYLHLGGNPKLTESLLQIGLTGYAFETVGVDRKTPLLAPMSALAGRLSVQLGARFLHSSQGGRGTLLGGTLDHSSGKVVVLGAGVAGTEAAVLARQMGAEVWLIDLAAEAMARAHQAAAGLHCEVSQPGLLERLLPKADLLVGAVYLPGKRAPIVVTEQQMALMPEGSVAVDIAIDQGGCFATSRPCTHKEPFYRELGVLHSAITNLPAAVPRTASTALSEAVLPYLIQMADGKVDAGLARGLNLRAGRLELEL